MPARKPKIPAWHVAVAAEAIAAALFARCGLDVSVQYGANQPEYDLIVAEGAKLLKVSVKGSQDGGWGLTQSFIKDADYQAAAKAWLARHQAKTIFCFVQFQGVPLLQMPRVYLATPREVSDALCAGANGRGDTILWENHTWAPRAHAAGVCDRIPDYWVFSRERVEQLWDAA